MDHEQIAEAAFKAASAANQAAHAGRELHASQAHECPRQLHYRAQGLPHSDHPEPGLNIEQHFGTALHDLYLPYLADQWRRQPGVAEVKIEPELRVTGLGHTVVVHPDLVVFFTDGTAQVGDLKTGKKYLVDAARAGEPKLGHLDQCRIGAVLVEAEHGTPVTGYWLYYIDRAEPKHHHHRHLTRRPWNDAEAERGQALIEHLLTIADNLQAAPRWFGKRAGDAAAPYSPCLSCPWQTMCLGKDDDGRPSAEVVAELVAAGRHTKAEVREAEDKLIEFLRLKAGVADAKRGKSNVTELVKALDIEPGVYDVDGVERRLSWRPGHDRVDAAAAAKMLRALGEEVPQVHYSGYYEFQ